MVKRSNLPGRNISFASKFYTNIELYTTQRLSLLIFHLMHSE